MWASWSRDMSRIDDVSEDIENITIELKSKCMYLRKCLVKGFLNLGKERFRRVKLRKSSLKTMDGSAGDIDC